MLFYIEYNYVAKAIYPQCVDKVWIDACGNIEKVRLSMDTSLLLARGDNLTLRTEVGKSKNYRHKIVSIVVVLIITVSILPRAKTFVDLSLKKAVLEKQEQKLHEENKELAQQIKELESPEAVERLAREKLGMVKKGERRVMELQLSK